MCTYPCRVTYAQANQLSVDFWVYVTCLGLQDRTLSFSHSEKMLLRRDGSKQLGHATATPISLKKGLLYYIHFFGKCVPTIAIHPPTLCLFYILT